MNMTVNGFLMSCRNNMGMIIIHKGYESAECVYSMEDRDFSDWDGWKVGGWQIGINDMMVPEIHIYAYKEGC